jgi:hypothetical protein
MLAAQKRETENSNCITFWDNASSFQFGSRKYGKTKYQVGNQNQWILITSSNVIASPSLFSYIYLRIYLLVLCLTTLSVAETILYRKGYGRKLSWPNLRYLLSRHLPGGTEKNHEKLSITTAGLRADYGGPPPEYVGLSFSYYVLYDANVEKKLQKQEMIQFTQCPGKQYSEL